MNPSDTTTSTRNHESFLSGLAAIAALLGIAGAVARLVWVRARGLGQKANAGTIFWMVALATVVGLAIIAWVFLKPQPGAPGSDRKGPPTIAVLPLTTMSDVAEHEWLSDGMTEDIITLLARSPGLRMIARNSTFQYKGQSVDIREVGEALGADFVVEGSLRPIGDRIRVTVQLTDVGLGTHVWAKKYDRPLADIFALQDEVTTAIAAGVGCIGGINAVYFEIESGNATLRADAKERLASTTAGDVGFATEFREPMWSAGSFEGFVRGTWCLLGPAGVSDTAPGVRPASHPCVREGSAVSLAPLGPAILVAAALGRRV